MSRQLPKRAGGGGRGGERGRGEGEGEGGRVGERRKRKDTGTDMYVNSEIGKKKETANSDKKEKRELTKRKKICEKGM